MNEVWRPVAGYEGFYQVSDLGRIRSLSRIVERRAGPPFQLNGRVLRCGHDGSGYEQVLLSVAANRSHVKIHRIVAATFVPNPENFPVVNHKNGIKTDNRAANLEWCTIRENTIHAIANGLTNPAFGERAANSVLTDDIVKQIRDMASSGVSQSDIGRLFGIHRSMVCRIVKRNTWSRVA